MGSWFVWEYTFLSAVGHIRLIRFLIFHLYLGSSRAPPKYRNPLFDGSDPTRAINYMNLPRSVNSSRRKNTL